MSPSSQQKFSYTSSGQSYTLKNINNSTHNIHSGVGFDLYLDTGFLMVTKYQRNQAIGSGHTDNYIIGIDANTKCYRKEIKSKEVDIDDDVITLLPCDYLLFNEKDLEPKLKPDSCVIC